MLKVDLLREQGQRGFPRLRITAMNALFQPPDERRVIEKALRHNLAFRDWPSSSLDELVEASRLVHYERGMRIVSSQVASPETCFIVSGRLLLVRSFDGSGESIVGLLGANMVFGELMQGVGAAHSLDCVAYEKAVVIHIEWSKLCQMLDQTHQRWIAFSRMLLASETTLLHTLIGQATGRISQRVAYTLQQYTELYGVREGDDRRAKLTISQDDIGALLRVSRKSIWKALRQLEELKLIECGYNSITVQDVNALRIFTGVKEGLSKSAPNVLDGLAV